MKQKCHSIFSNFLENNGRKYSEQRKTIVNEIFKIHRHFEPQQFINKLCKKYSNISRATIFRTIKLLLEADLISKTSNTDGLVTYEHILGHNHHDHLICIKCNKVTEISNRTLESLKTKVCSSFGFTHKYHSLQIYGVCKKCRKKK